MKQTAICTLHLSADGSKFAERSSWYRKSPSENGSLSPLMRSHGSPAGTICAAEDPILESGELNGISPG